MRGRIRSWTRAAQRDVLLFCGAVFAWSIAGFTILVTGAAVNKLWTSRGREAQLNTTASAGFVPRAASRTRVSQTAGRTTCVGCWPSGDPMHRTRSQDRDGATTCGTSRAPTG